MGEATQFKLVADRKGVVSDLLLYIPTVIALGSIATSFWFSDNQNMAYLFYFLTCFFVIAGVNRVFKTRLMLFPSAPIEFTINDQVIVLGLKNGAQINLIKNVKYYSDYSGKTYGLSGLNGEGKQLQFVFHKGQFAREAEFDAAQLLLKARFK